MFHICRLLTIGCKYKFLSAIFQKYSQEEEEAIVIRQSKKKTGFVEEYFSKVIDPIKHPLI